jgi:hypothetical protein
MAWTLYSVPTNRRTDLDTALHDDLVSRQSQKVREAPSIGGPAGETYVLVEGSSEGIRRADELLGAVGKKLSGPDGEQLYRRFKEEEDQASSGMGLFFTED